MRRGHRREGRSVTAGGLVLVVERVDAQTACIRVDFMQVTLSTAEMRQLKRDLEQAMTELFPEEESES